MEYLSVTERQLNFDTDAVFRLFDDDEVRIKYARYHADNYILLTTLLLLRISWWILWSSCLLLLSSLE